MQLRFGAAARLPAVAARAAAPARGRESVQGVDGETELLRRQVSKRAFCQERPRRRWAVALGGSCSDQAVSDGRVGQCWETSDPRVQVRPGIAPWNDADVGGRCEMPGSRARSAAVASRVRSCGSAGRGACLRRPSTQAAADGLIGRASQARASRRGCDRPRARARTPSRCAVREPRSSAPRRARP
jgi:hypothetical protein